MYFIKCKVCHQFLQLNVGFGIIENILVLLMMLFCMLCFSVWLCFYTCCLADLKFACFTTNIMIEICKQTNIFIISIYTY